MIHCFNFVACNCYKAGSQSQTFDVTGKCICKYGYERQKCSWYIDGFYQQSANNLQPTCSGINTCFVLIFGFVAIIAKFIA